MVVTDVPVELEQGILDHQLRTTRDVAAADVDLVGVARDGLRTGDGRGGYADIRQGAAKGAENGHLARAFELFEVGKEKQLVLDDRPAQGDALGVFLERSGGEVAAIGAVELVARQAVVAEHVVHAALEIVGARLGDRIDVGAGESLQRGIEVRYVDLHGLNGIDRNRLLQGRQVVGFKAEAVADVDAVNGDRVVAAVLAGYRDLAAILVGLRQARIESGYVLQVALDGRVGGQFAVADAGTRAHAGAVELVADGAAGDFDGGGDHTQLAVQRQGLGQQQVDAVALVAQSALADDDRVGPAHAQTPDVVAARSVREHGVDRAGLGVADGDRGAPDRHA